MSHATAVACRMGMARRPVELAIAFVAMGALGCSKSKLEATVKGYKPGSSSIVLVHVKGDKGATVDCTPAGLDYARTDLGAAGEADVEIDLLLAGDKPKVVVLHSQIGRRQATATVDFAGSRLGVRFDFAGGSITCISPTCSGMVSLAPTASLSFTAAPGTTVDIGNEHFKTDAAGELHTPLALTTTPPLKDLQASKLCNHTASPVGKTKLTLTFADGSKGTSNLALTTEMVTSGLGPTLWAIKKGPVLFPWEKAGATPRAKRAAFALDLNGCTAFGGPPRRDAGGRRRSRRDRAEGPAIRHVHLRDHGFVRRESRHLDWPDHALRRDGNRVRPREWQEARRARVPGAEGV